MTRNQINGYIWLTNTPLPQEICDREPLLKDYGLFRRLNDGNFEFISVCDARIKNFISMHKDDLARILNGTQKMLDQKAAIRALAPALPAGEDNR